MNTTPKLHHTRFRYSLRTLFVVMTVLGAGLGWLGWQAVIVERRDEIKNDIIRRGGLIGFDADGSRVFGVRRWLGDRPVASISLLSASFSKQEQDKIANVFPEAKIGESDVFFDPLRSPPIERD